MQPRSQRGKEKARCANQEPEVQSTSQRCKEKARGAKHKPEVQTRSQRCKDTIEDPSKPEVQIISQEWKDTIEEQPMPWLNWPKTLFKPCNKLEQLQLLFKCPTATAAAKERLSSSNGGMLYLDSKANLKLFTKACKALTRAFSSKPEDLLSFIKDLTGHT